MMNEAIDRLHADAVCALGLYLHGNEKTDRVKALKVHEDAVDALASGAAGMIRERDATIARLVAHERNNLGAAIRLQGEIARLRSALAAASADLSGSCSRNAAMVKADIDIVLAAVPS